MKNLKILLILCWVALPTFVFAQNLEYSLLTLPDSLTKNADVVVRQHHQQFIVENAGKAVYKIKKVYTILNKGGDNFATLQLSHDKLMPIKSLEGNLYDAMGTLVTKLKKSNIEDQVHEADYEFTDNKVRVAKFDYGQYPYTVEFEYEQEYGYMMVYPRFMPQYSSAMSVEKATFTVEMPAKMKLRHRESNMGKKLSINTKDDRTSYTWTLKNLPAFKYEPFAPNYDEIFPIVYVAPSDFRVKEYEGNLDTWQGFGNFQNTLNKERDILPATTVEKVQQLVADAPNKYEKVKRIYEYLQSKTRYVSIQLGIGGWQPIPAETVDKKGYGDCKGLSNYTKAMLKAAGIESHYTIIDAGDTPRKVFPDFTCDAFNHIILCVPMERDTVWLECTSQNKPFNFLGNFTDDRYCLLVTPSGGKLARTPKYAHNMNTQTRQIAVKMLPSGEANAKITTTYKGLQTENNGLDFVIHESKDTQKKWLVEKHLKLPQFDLMSFELKQLKEKTPTVVENLEVTLKSFGTKNGKRIFLMPNLMNKETRVLPDEKRRFDIHIDEMDYIDVDTVQFEIPEGYHVEGSPAEHNFKSTFGEYKTTVKVEQGKLTYIRTMSMRNGHYSKQLYKELVEFYRNVVKADNSKIVLVKET